MSYYSPIEIVKKMQEQYEEDIVNNVIKCVQSYGINVNKEELIKALKYDRQQYEKGYKDGAKEFAEQYKAHLEHIQEHEKELLDEAAKYQYPYLVEYRKGTTDMLDRLLLYIDGTLEKFWRQK